MKIGCPQNFDSSLLCSLMCFTHCVSGGTLTGGITWFGCSCTSYPAAGSRWTFCHLAVEIAWRLIELLSFPLVHVRPDGMSVGAMELGVDVDQRLHVVVAGGNLAQAL